MWRIANNRSLSDVEMWLAMLDQAAQAIRPGQSFRGMLARIDGPDMIVEAIADAPLPGSLPDDGNRRIGQVRRVVDTIYAKIIAEGGGTEHWNDIQIADSASAAIRSRGWRALIMTTFTAGGSMYVLSFVSPEVTRGDFGTHDRTYIEVLAAFFANHLQQRWQSDRLQYQQSHDALTGLLNRSHFRSQTRIGAAQRVRFGVVLVDVDHLGEVNEKFGHITGDALIVEVAAALRRCATGGELVGRVGGNTFAIYLPNLRSKASFGRRVSEFSKVFAEPFSTGDRAGEEFIALSASVGAACAPEDGSDVDTLFSRAEIALSAAKRHGHGSLRLYSPAIDTASS
jgi:diguanylate cyclase (GGDEF)-like protein